jgi:hypothetical protein
LWWCLTVCCYCTLICVLCGVSCYLNNVLLFSCNVCGFFLRWRFNLGFVKLCNLLSLLWWCSGVLCSSCYVSRWPPLNQYPYINYISISYLICTLLNFACWLIFFISVYDLNGWLQRVYVLMSYYKICDLIQFCLNCGSCWMLDLEALLTN